MSSSNLFKDHNVHISMNLNLGQVKPSRIISHYIRDKGSPCQTFYEKRERACVLYLCHQWGAVLQPVPKQAPIKLAGRLCPGHRHHRVIEYSTDVHWWAFWHCTQNHNKTCTLKLISHHKYTYMYAFLTERIRHGTTIPQKLNNVNRNCS